MSTLLLDKLIDPSSVAIIGASGRIDSSGHLLASNVLGGDFKGDVYLVNPRYRRVMDQPCYKSVKALPAAPDLALILTPTRLLRQTLVECARKGIKLAIVMSGTGKSQELHAYARRLGMRLLGPYCAGLILPHRDLNATFSANRVKKGNLAIISQSASLAAAMVDWAERNNVGFSALLSTGRHADISLADLLDLLAEDRHTRAVIVYVDHVNASRSFLSALSATARTKPVVLMRSTQAGVTYCDALTRSGQVISTDDVFQAALKRAGVVRIRTFENLFAAAQILSSKIRIRGNRIAVISNGNAPAMIASEKLQTKHFEIPALETGFLKKLKKTEAIEFTGNNPLLLRDVDHYAQHLLVTIQQLQDLDTIDAVLVIYVPDSRNDPSVIAESVIACSASRKPLITCWMGDTSVLQAREELSSKGIPTFRTPEAATDALDFLHRYLVSQQQLLQLPNPASRYTRADADAAKTIVRAELHTGKRVLGPVKTRTLMELFDIPVLPSQRATQLDDALAVARTIGYPVAMKLVSPNISYKASVVATQLNVGNDAQLTHSWHLIESRLSQHRPDAEFRGVLIEAMHTPGNQRHLALSLSRDPLLGPVISIGMGGELTTLLHQRIVQLPPLNNFLIEEVLSNRQLQMYFGAFRHTQAIDTTPVVHVLRRLSELACELPEIFSLDINPLVVSDDGAMAMDTQIVLEQAGSQKRYQHLAIHPYPWEWIRNIVNRKGTAIQLRPIRPSDAAALNTLVREMSAESRYFRFMHAINELSPQMVVQFTKLDYDRQMAFVATRAPTSSKGLLVENDLLLGVSRYTISNNRRMGEFAVSVSDNSKGQGIATELMKLLIEHAKFQDLKMLQGDVLRSNSAMHGLMDSMGFTSEVSPEDHEVLLYTYKLDQSDEKPEP